MSNSEKQSKQTLSQDPKIHPSAPHNKVYGYNFTV